MAPRTRAASGVAANVPTYAGATQTATGGNSDYSKKTDKTTYGVDKTVEQTRVAPGTVERLNVALLVDTSVPGREQLWHSSRPSAVPSA